MAVAKSLFANVSQSERHSLGEEERTRIRKKRENENTSHRHFGMESDERWGLLSEEVLKSQKAKESTGNVKKDLIMIYTELKQIRRTKLPHVRRLSEDFLPAMPNSLKPPSAQILNNAATEDSHVGMHKLQDTILSFFRFARWPSSLR